jgi:hypothetical protein
VNPADLADLSSVVEHHRAAVATEDAEGLIASEKDRLTVREDLNWVAFREAQSLAEFLGKYHPPKVVHLSNDSSRFQSHSPSIGSIRHYR